MLFCKSSIKYFNNCLLLLLTLVAKFSAAQNYQSIHGSMYAGSLAPANNPAAIQHVPFSWDVTVFATQAKQSTNAFIIKDFSLLSPSSNAVIVSDNGVKKRFFFTNQDMHLFNARIRLNENSTIAFGGNVRSYAYANSSETNYQDTVYSLADFLKINVDRQPLSGQAVGSSWLEGYFTYSRKLVDDGFNLLNAGITVKANRSLGGGYARAQDLRYSTSFDNDGRAIYALETGSLQYGYSYNFDYIRSNSSTSTNAKNFLKRAYNNVGFDVGIEYIMQGDVEDDDEADDFSYTTKIGISLMDIGANKYRHSSNSGLAIAGKNGITDTVLENKFRDVQSVKQFKDTLASISNSFTNTVTNFVVYQPTRLMINVDQYMGRNFFVNAELTLPVISLAGSSTLFIKDMNLLAVTPRWETKSFGLYMPLLMNMKKQFWVGGALRAGPLLLGVHNLSNLFSKNKIQNGGGYIALTIRPGRSYSREGGDAEKLSKQQRRNLDCPRF